MRAICPKCNEMNEPAYKNHKGGRSYLCECGHFWEINPATLKKVEFRAYAPDGQSIPLSPTEPGFHNFDTMPEGSLPCPRCNKIAKTISYNVYEMSKTCHCPSCGYSWKLPSARRFWD